LKVCDFFLLQNTICVFLPHNTTSMSVCQCSSIGSAWTVVQWYTEDYWNCFNYSKCKEKHL